MSARRLAVIGSVAVGLALVAFAHPQLRRPALDVLACLVVGLALVQSRGKKPEPTPDFAPERASLQRRLALVMNASPASDLTTVGRKVVAAVAEELGAPVVLLHVPPVGEPLAPEVVASVGVSSVRASSPHAVREVLASGISITIPLLDDEEAERLSVSTSMGRATPKLALVQPIIAQGRTLAVAEIGVTRALTEERQLALESLLQIAGHAISHALAVEYASRLSTEVRAQAADVAGVYSELDTVFESVADGLVVTDASGEVIRLNAAARAILAAREGEEHSPELVARRNEALMRALEAGADGQEVALEASGEARTIHLRISPLDDARGSRAVVAVLRDVTREKQLELDLRKHSGELEKHVAELERATKLKSEFLANMSHELRTPLNAIIGFTEILLEGTYGALNAKQSGCAKDVLAGGKHLLGLINDILDLSKIEAGKMELQRDEVDLAAVVDQALVMIRPQAAAKQIELTVDTREGRYLVHGDNDRLRQVALNLLSNAVKFTPSGGRVGVTLEPAENGSAKLIVEDSGIGIAEEHAHRLFKEFSQVDGSNTRRFGGTGLGLAISRRLVEMHGGTIGFTSQVGVGSRFFFQLPRIAAKRAFSMLPPNKTAHKTPSHSPLPLPNLPPPPPVARLSGGPHVICVDADPGACALVEHTLQEAGMSVSVAHSLDEVRAIAAAIVPEVVIWDTSIVSTSLGDAIHYVHEELRCGLVVTSIVSEDELSLASDHKVHYVGKPLDRTLLLDRVRDALHRKRSRRALLVDSVDVHVSAVQKTLEKGGYVVEVARSLAEAKLALSIEFDLVVTELDLSDANGEHVARDLRALHAGPLAVLACTVTPEIIAALAKVTPVVCGKGALSRDAFLARVEELFKKPRKTRVLAVDDNEQNLRLVRAVLARREVDLVEASDAQTAIDLARDEHPDIILMDVMLPGIDGLTATRTLKQDPITREIPVIAVTANAMTGDAERAREAGCVGYVTKPFDARRLLDAIDSALA